MYGRKRSFFTGFFLRMLSILYGAAVSVRPGFYKSGFLRKKKLDQPVLSVGNITLGGTGKTPAVINIANVLLRHRQYPAVVSRGYGRDDESSVLVVSDGKQILTDPRIGGDEPVLIGSKLISVPVVVGSDRFSAAVVAHNKFGNDIVILDDGFQHIRLHRDLDIVLVDAGDPFGNGRLFPAGILRERLAALARAHAVLITNIDQARNLEQIKKTIRQHTSAQVFTSRAIPVDVIEIVTKRKRSLSTLNSASVLAFSGIARPASFTSALRSLGAEIKSELIYADHYAYTETDLAAIVQEAKDKKVSMIITTEKDAVRLKNLNPDEIWALRIELEVIENEAWEAVLLNLANSVRKKIL